MPDLHQALARFRYLTVGCQEEDPDSMHRLAAGEWEGMLGQAAKDAILAGATSEDLQEIQDAYP